ncbi:MAG: hypothetical protein AB2387_09900 [Stutzerimonas stutzeri]
MNAKHVLAVAVTAALLSACTATTSLRSTDPDLAIKINQDAPLVLKNPVSKTVSVRPAPTACPSLE